MNRNNIKQYLPPPIPKQRFYTLAQVTQHNTANDCWIILFGQVYNLSKLIQQNIQSPQSRPLIEAAGTDITFWFDSVTREPRVKVDIETGLHQFYCPNGKYLHLETNNEVKWWKDQQNIIGKLTKKSRSIKLINMITDHTNILEVPSEQTINQILTRYKKFNKHGGSYVWKRLGRPLDMEKTLTENGIEDEDPEFEKLGIEASQWYIPTIHLFFSDDLTFA